MIKNLLFIFLLILSKNYGQTMPVEMVYFDFIILEDGINLKWGTATEIQNYGFEVQRSKNLIEWDSLDFVFGFGTSFVEHDYSFIDSAIKISGIYYYRLKQIDLNFDFEYSDIVTVNYTIVNVKEEIPANFDLILYQNFPNPFNPTTKIRYTIPTSPQTPLLGKERGRGEVVTLKIYDILGNEIVTLVNEEKSPGEYEIEFDASKYGLSSGIYFYRIAIHSDQIKVSQYSEVKKTIYLE